MPAPADFLGADFKEMFKTASVLVLWWWLQFKNLLVSACHKKLKLCMCILLESRRYRGTATADSNDVLLGGVKDRLLGVQW